MTWYVEEGIGEHRAVRLADDRIVAARVAWPGELAAGLIADAVLIARAKGSPRGTARFPGGEEALVDRLPASASEGAPIRLLITRPALAERGRYKRAQARPTDERPRLAPSLAESLRADGTEVRIVTQFPPCDWDELIGEAFAQEIDFSGGAAVLSPTPAMLLIDIDGHLPPRALALAAVSPIAEALRRFDIGGSVAIDFPTLSGKDDRRAVDQALADALEGWPHERTAMNGFGLVQLVARLERVSLLHRAAFQPAQTAVRRLLRQAERLQGAGALALAGHPALEPNLKADMRAELVQRSGREVRWSADPGLALQSPHAQLVPR
jgi:hypothetical protein